MDIKRAKKILKNACTALPIIDIYYDKWTLESAMEIVLQENKKLERQIKKLEKLEKVKSEEKRNEYNKNTQKIEEKNNEIKKLKIDYKKNINISIKNINTIKIKDKQIHKMAEFIERFMIEDSDNLLKEVCDKKGSKYCDDCYSDMYMDCVECIKDKFKEEIE